MKDTVTNTTTKQYILSTLLRAVIGAGFAGLVTAVTMLIIFWTGLPQQLESQSLLIFYKSFIVSVVIGFVYGGISILFDIEKLSLLLATFLHFLVICAVYFGLAIWAQWFLVNTLTIIIQIIAFVVIYVAIWLMIYFIQRKRVDQLNKELEQLYNTNK